MSPVCRARTVLYTWSGNFSKLGLCGSRCILGLPTGSELVNKMEPLSLASVSFISTYQSWMMSLGSCISLSVLLGVLRSQHTKTWRNTDIPTCCRSLWVCNLQLMPTRVAASAAVTAVVGSPLWCGILLTVSPGMSLTHHDVGGIDVVRAFPTQGRNANPGSLHWNTEHSLQTTTLTAPSHSPSTPKCKI